MKVLLLKAIPGVGRANDIVEAKEGYVHNFLIPRGLGKIVTKQVGHELEVKKEKKIIHASELKAFQVEAKKKLNEMGTIEFVRKASDKGHLFGAITEKDIAQELKEKAKIELKSEFIILSQSIKSVGTYSAKIKLGDQSATINIEVKAA